MARRVQRPRTLKMDPALEYFNNPEFSDLTLVCASTKFYVHKIILSMRCTYFAKLLAGPFAEAGETEITLKEDDPEAFEIMLKYLYGDRRKKRVSSCISDLLRDIKVHTVANKYGIQDLEDDAECAFWRGLDEMVQEQAPYDGTTVNVQALRLEEPEEGDEPTYMSIFRKVFDDDTTTNLDRFRSRTRRIIKKHLCNLVKNGSFRMWLLSHNELLMEMLVYR